MIEWMASGPHGESKWVEYRVTGPIAKQLEYADKVIFTHKASDGGCIVATFRKVSNANS